MPRSSSSRRLLGSSTIFIFSALLLGGAVLMSTPGFRDSIGNAFQGIQWKTLGPSMSTGATLKANLSDSSSNTADLQNKIKSLEKENAEALLQLAKLETELAALKSESQLLVSRPNLEGNISSLLALGKTIDGQSERLWVQRQEGNELLEGMTVIGPEGYIGKIVSVRDDFGLVELLTDEGTTVGARSAESQDLGIVTYSRELGEVVFLPEHSTPSLEVDQTIVTSGLKGSPHLTGLSIGKVTGFDTNKNGEHVAILKTAQSIDQIHTVFLINQGQAVWSPDEAR